MQLIFRRLILATVLNRLKGLRVNTRRSVTRLLQESRRKETTAQIWAITVWVERRRIYVGLF